MGVEPKILSESKQRGQEQIAKIRCSKCNSEIATNIKFCPQCGNAIDTNVEKTGTRVEFEYPNDGISIEFAESSSATFDAALSEARNAPIFQECRRAGKAWYLANWPLSQITRVIKFIDNLKGMRNRKAYLNNKETQWDELFGFAGCAQERSSAYRPIEYCFGMDEKRLNLWGCKQLNMDWSDWTEWFSYGKFVKNDLFVFDKNRIWHEISNGVQQCQLCPYLRRNLIKAVFNLLPNEVYISKKGGWKYKEDYQQRPGSIKVIQEEKYAGCTSTHEFYSDGVIPVGFDVARDILTKAFKECGITDIDIKTLVP